VVLVKLVPSSVSLFVQPAFASGFDNVISIHKMEAAFSVETTIIFRLIDLLNRCENSIIADCKE
jgi:hypothetical protein